MTEFNLGLVWLALGRPADARHWLRQSYQSARVVVDTLARQFGDVKVLRSRWTTVALTSVYPVGMFGVPAKVKKVWNAEPAREAIESCLPFVRCVADALYRFRARRRCCDLRFGRRSRLRQDRGSWLFVCST